MAWCPGDKERQDEDRRRCQGWGHAVDANGLDDKEHDANEGETDKEAGDTEEA